MVRKRRIVSNILNIKWIDKVGKYVVDLAVLGESKKTVWLTERQLDNLKSCFAQTPKEYSTSRRTVYGHWNQQGFYAYTTVEDTRIPHIFREPKQRDLSDLWEDDTCG